MYNYLFATCINCISQYLYYLLNVLCYLSHHFNKGLNFPILYTHSLLWKLQSLALWDPLLFITLQTLFITSCKHLKIQGFELSAELMYVQCLKHLNTCI